METTEGTSQTISEASNTQIINTDTQQLSFDASEISAGVPQDVQAPTDAQDDAQQSYEQAQESTQQTSQTIQEQVNSNEATLKAVQKHLSTQGVDLNVAIKEYQEYGALSKQTMADLSRAGYPKELIEGFIASRQMLEQQFTDAVYKMAGGAQEYANTIEWAKTSLPEKTVRAFNKAIDSNDLETISLIFDGMKARRTAQMGTRKPSLIGQPSNKTPTQGFKDKQEMIAAMSDPRYYKDEKYNRAVTQKLLNSKNIF